jgi:hypothetical protein
MKVGTKSLLVGAHQFLWHPITVTLAWRELYEKWPNWKEMICIIVHDWGYLGCSDIDGKEGEEHPYKGAEIVTFLDHNFYMGTGELPGDDKWLTKSKEIEWKYYFLALRHSRNMANRYHKEPSKLCWADKLSVKFDPWFLYLPRVLLSGEIKEYRKSAADFGEIPLSASDKEWYLWARKRMIHKAYTRDSRPAYTEGS